MTRLFLALVLFLGALATPLAQPGGGTTRVIAIGDIHGAYDELTLILRRAGLVDDRLAWVGGRATLVQTGDYTDRGADVRKVLDLLMRLEREARAAGGRVITLLGNHEVMNLIGEWRDVTPEICASFATPASEARREEEWTRFVQLRGAAEPTTGVFAQSREQFMAALPLGCLEYRDAMAPRGVYGRWLRSKSIAAKVGDTLFMHAGVNPARPAPRSVDDVNNRARNEIRRLDAYRQRLVDRKMGLASFTLQQVIDVSANALRTANDALIQAKQEGTAPPSLDLPTLRQAQGVMDIATWSLIDPEGPLWFRGYALWDEAATAAQVNALLDHLKVTRIVVGHTTTTNRRITLRYNGRVVLIDTGMLASVYKGVPAALEMTETTLKAIYPDGEQALPAGAVMPALAGPAHWLPQD